MNDAGAQKQNEIAGVLALAPVVAVIVIADAAQAVPLARALVAGGIRALEVTLRTSAALDAIRAIAAEVEDAVVGAGTVLAPRDLAAAGRAGARFGVSPGATASLLDAADDGELPFLPGAATASEVMVLAERGYRHQKFFPAELAGGAALLRALASPLPNVRFCPTGGIGLVNAESYLHLPNVAAIGGSWLTPKALLDAGDWSEVTALARAAAALGRA